jgi:hypothetical protein
MRTQNPARGKAAVWAAGVGVGPGAAWDVGPDADPGGGPGGGADAGSGAGSGVGAEVAPAGAVLNEAALDAPAADALFDDALAEALVVAPPGLAACLARAARMSV